MKRHTRYGDTSGPARLGAVDGYATRILVCLAATLILLIGAVHLPWHAPPDPVGWLPPAPYPDALLAGTEVKPSADRTAHAPVTRFERPASETGSLDAADDEATTVDDEPLPTPAPLPQRLKARRAVLETAEEPPDIVGGLGSYYIHIQYPADAILAGIEGRLVLEFIVEPDGHPSQIRVAQALYPSCDSAAVRALRRTRFVPGRQDGKAVRVRMRLPVLFKLLPRASNRGT